jgi:hypothetical protein
MQGTVSLLCICAAVLCLRKTGRWDASGGGICEDRQMKGLGVRCLRKTGRWDASGGGMSVKKDR